MTEEETIRSVVLLMDSVGRLIGHKDGQHPASKELIAAGRKKIKELLEPSTREVA